MSIEYCKNCGEETGKAGKYEDSLFPILKNSLHGACIGDTYGPVCDDCWLAMDRLELIDHEG